MWQGRGQGQHSVAAAACSSLEVVGGWLGAGWLAGSAWAVGRLDPNLLLGIAAELLQNVLGNHTEAHRRPLQDCIPLGEDTPCGGPQHQQWQGRR